MISGPLHSDVKGGPLHLQFGTPPPGSALCAAVVCAISMRNSRDAGLPQQEPESSCIQEARAVELNPTCRLVGKSPGQKGGVSFRVDQREARATDGAAVGFCPEVHKHTGVAKGNVEGGPDIEPCKSYRKECTNAQETFYLLVVHLAETFLRMYTIGKIQFFI